MMELDIDYQPRNEEKDPEGLPGDIVVKDGDET